MNRTLAHFFSILGHPLLVLTYMLLLMLLANPYAFGFRTAIDKQAMILFFSVLSTTFILPGFGVAMLRPLGFIKSMQMEDKQERTGPYIITGIFYLWMFKNLYSGGGQVPALYATFVLGATIGLFLAFFLNIFTKVSAHATGMGGFIAMVLLTALKWNDCGIAIPLGGTVLGMSLNIVLGLVIVFAGIIGMARLALNAHIPADLYRGYAAGFGAVLLAALILR